MNETVYWLREIGGFLLYAFPLAFIVVFDRWDARRGSLQKRVKELEERVARVESRGSMPADAVAAIGRFEREYGQVMADLDRLCRQVERERRRVDRDSVRFQRMLQRYERRVGRRFSDGGPVGFGEMPLVQDRVPWR